MSSQKEPLNTVHVIMDTLKRSYLGCYGSEWVKTPNLDRFAGMSVQFTQAYSASFPCMPARADFATGNYEFPFKGWSPLEEDAVRVSRTLGDGGNTTALVTDHYHLFRWGSGNFHFDYDSWQFIRGLEGDRLYTDPAEELNINYECDPDRLVKTHRDNYYKFKHFEMKTEEDWSAARTFMTATDWVERNKGHKGGFHLQIDSFPPHEPFDPPPGYSEMYDPDYKGDRLTTPFYQPSEENYTSREVKNIQALYAGTITYVDKWFGRFLDKLEELGLMENTMVIVTTDHGTYTGDHGWTGKLGTYLYDCVCHIPMMIYHPGVKGRRETAITQNVDIVPTMLDAAALGDQYKCHGRSLMPIILGEEEKVRDYAHSGFYGFTHIVNDGRYALHLFHDQTKELYWHGLTNTYFCTAGPLGPVEEGHRRKVDTSGNDYWCPPALFDLETDPGQTKNLFNEKPEIVERFKKEIVRFCGEIKAPAEYTARIIGEN